MIGRLALIASAAILCSACGGTHPIWPAEAESRSWTIPLVLAWNPARLLVEVDINRAGPVLMVIDTTRERGRLRPDVAARLKLSRIGDPTRGRRVLADRVALGELVLGRVAFELEDGAMGEVFGRPIVGTLGRDWLEGRPLDFDRDAGVLRVPARAPTPAAAGSVEIESTSDGWRVPVTLAGERLEMMLSTVAGPAAMTPDAARRVSAAIEEAGVGSEPPIRIGGVDAAPGPWRLDADADADGALTLTAMSGLNWRLDPTRERLVVWPSATSTARFGRFGDAPVCQSEPTQCVRGQVAAVADGKVTLAFEGPDAAVPARFWYRLDLGAPGRPYSVLVQVNARPEGAEGVLTAVVEDRRLTPDSVRPIGAAVEVVDVVPVDRPCRGTVCLQRQEGDAAEGVVESSARR